jgi:hypothetical protein
VNVPRCISYTLARLGTGPRPVRPRERGRIDHHRRPEHAIGLETRDRIGLAVLTELEPVALTGTDSGHAQLEIAILQALHRAHRIVLEHQADVAMPRRP